MLGLGLIIWYNAYHLPKKTLVGITKENTNNTYSDKNGSTTSVDTNVDCSFWSFDNVSKSVVMGMSSGKGLYRNSAYNFQIDLPSNYVVKEYNGNDYCQDSLVFSKPEDSTLSGRLLVISIEPAKGDLNYTYTNKWKYDIDKTQKFDVMLGGQPALKVNAYSWTVYLMVYQGKLYQISTQLSKLTSEQVNSVISSFKFTK